ncbi:hypothetical protein BRADI_2g12330v3 [Brachypodium distachyon]|uniref:GDSL esterase/lipase n=1 Tax=Brachypodium distachyon TaxID=15368 RepID=A0A2K2D840_BRADI|nr:hypothetical protein BRADI_2g12330v3 [Brachypodium distachyon]
MAAITTGAFAAAISIAVVFTSTILASAAAQEAASPCARRPVVFALGDSNTDTGGMGAALGSYLPLPEGRTHFRRSTGRLCDGRLVVDYLCESLNMSYLSPYLEALGSDFSNGANFAIAGAATMPRDRPFALHVQVQQFLHFKQRSLDLASRGESMPVDAHGFRDALYLIDIGQNDLSAAFSSRVPYDDVISQRIPAILSEIKDAIMTLYYNGAKNFWVHGTGPLGCLPQKLAEPRTDDSDLDYNGCLKTLNSASYEFNNQLCSICDKLRTQLKGATIVYTDLLAIKVRGAAAGMLRLRRAALQLQLQRELPRPWLPGVRGRLQVRQLGRCPLHRRRQRRRRGQDPVLGVLHAKATLRLLLQHVTYLRYNTTSVANYKLSDRP